MAIVWGSAVSDATNAFRIGYQISQSPSTVSNGTSSVVVTLSIYLGTKYYANDSSADWTISGDIAASGGTSFDHNSGTAWSSSNVTLLATRTKTVTTSFTGTVVTNGSATVTGLAAIAGTASVSWSITTAQRPVGLPASPTGCAVARNSDTQQTVTWANTSPTSASNPYTNVVVERSTDDGAYVAIATLGVVTSYADKTTSSNHHYRYRVRAKNGAGYSGYSTSATIYTTPRAPNTPTAAKTSTGDITVTWTNASSQASATEVWHAANGVWDGAALTTTLAGNAVSYTHTAPSSSVTHTYRLRYKVSSPALTGPYSGNSNVVALTAPPSAPTNLAPTSGQARDAATVIALTWQHNPTDTTPQRKYEVQHRVNGGAWGSLTGVQTFSAQQANIAANTWPQGATVEWQVRTWGAATTGGADGTGASAWSATATLLTSTPPVTSVTYPDTTHNSSRLTATATYFDAEGTAQAGWEYQLLNASGAVLETLSGSGAGPSVTFSTRISDATTYTVRARSLDGSGLWGPYDANTFTVTYSLPEVPTLTLSWDEDAEAAIIAIDNPPTTSGKVDTDHNEVWRSIDGGPWLLVTDSAPVDGTVIDPIPAIGLQNAYKVVAVSALPSTATSDIGYRPNMVLNPTFETDVTNWSAARGTIAAVASSLATDGVQIMEYTSSDATVNGGNYVYANTYPVTVGKTYRASANVGIPSTGTLPQARIVLQWLDAANAAVGSATNGTALTLSPGDDLREITVEGVAPAGATQVRTLIYAVGQAMPVGHKLRVDSVWSGEKTPDNLPPRISSPSANGAVVNAGPGFALSAKLHVNIKAQITRGRAKVLKVFAGRTKPVEFTGEQRSRTVELSSLLSVQLATPVWEELEAISDQVAPACYRDPDGRRIFVSMGDPSVTGLGERSQQFSWSLTEVDYAERVES